MCGLALGICSFPHEGRVGSAIHVLTNVAFADRLFFLLHVEASIVAYRQFVKKAIRSLSAIDDLCVWSHAG